MAEIGVCLSSARQQHKNASDASDARASHAALAGGHITTYLLLHDWVFIYSVWFFFIDAMLNDQ